MNFIYIIVFLLIEASAYQGASNRLTRYLLKQHERNAPPDGLIIISQQIDLVHVITIDELKQTMTILVYIVEEWFDSTLTWDPATFSGLNVTWIPEHSIWVPDIIVFNMLSHQELLHAVRSPIKVFHTGRIVYSYPAIYTVMCHIGIAKFPFDDQKCDLRIASWGYPETKLRINASKPSLTHYSLNEEWALQNVSISNIHYEHEGTVVSEAHYVIAMSRKPFYYLISLVLPTYIICMLSISGLFARFSTKHERQERFTLGVTAILSMAVLSLVVTEKVPHSSEEVPLLVVYFHFNMVMVTIATVLTSTVMRVHIKGNNHHQLPPRWMSTLLLMKVKSYPEEKQGFLKRHLISEKWGEVSRRMDYFLVLAFLIIVTTPTVYLFYLCAVLDNTADEQRYLSNYKT